MSGWLAAAGWVAAAAVVVMVIRCRARLDERTDAVAHACHEVRGPLMAARLGLTLAQRTGRLEPLRLRALDQELERAVRTIDDLEQVRRGCPVLDVQRQAVDVHSLVADSVSAWQAAAAARGSRLRLRWSGPPVAVWGDRVRLAQAVGNLIANAIEHGGGPVVVLGSGRAESARIEVRDHGPGLDAPVADLIRRRPRSGGRGRGLGIAGSVAAAHGGRLSSAPSAAGARIVLTLPLDAAGRPARSGRS